MAVAPLPLGIPVQRAVELLFIEIRPQARAEVQFRVGQVPQQEIADALLTARPDEEVGVRNAGKGKLAPEFLLVDVR